jgi:DNA-binding transcriptional ArsR family regulator
MPNQIADLPRVFQALSDPTRLAVVARLAQGPASMSALAEPFDMALPSFSQHLRLLEGCGLVRSSKTGRVRTFELQPERLKAAEHWLNLLREHWEQRLDRLDAYLLTLKEPKP